MVIYRKISAFVLGLISIALSGSFPLFAADALQVPINDRVKINSCPLIGGPSWLKVHCKVVVDDSLVFDFVPQDAASAETIQKLISLQAVPATTRLILQNEKVDSEDINKEKNDDGKYAGQLEELYIRRAVQFCDDYDQDLHLIKNNCWSFAFDLIRHIYQT